MGAVSSSELDRAFESFYLENVRDFERYLVGKLGGDAEGRGGRVGVEDALQAGVIRMLKEWPALHEADKHERAERAYRCLKSAAIDALRTVHGRHGRGGKRNWATVSHDFTADARGDDEDVPFRDRRMQASVDGAMVHESCEGAREERAMVTRAVLLAGLGALTPREVIVLVAVEGQDRDQKELAAELGVDPGTVYESLHVARKLFYAIVQHAIGIEIEDEELARLYALQDGRLGGREKRLARRHLTHCAPCQALCRERRVFAANGQRVILALPFLFGTQALATKASAKAGASASAAAQAGKGLFAPAGAKKALASALSLLVMGFGTGAYLAVVKQPRPLPAAAGHVPVGSLDVRSLGMAISAPATHTTPQKKATPTRRNHTMAAHHKSSSSSNPSQSSSNAAASPPASTPFTPTGTTSPPAQSFPSPSPASSGSGGSTQGEFFKG